MPDCHSYFWGDTAQKSQWKEVAFLNVGSVGGEAAISRSIFELAYISPNFNRMRWTVREIGLPQLVLNILISSLET